MQDAALPIQSASGSYNAQAAGGSTAIVAVFQAAPPRPADPAEVAAAEALLAELPLDSLPEPSGLPAGSFMPWPRNRFFVGREPVLRELAREIKQGGTTAVGRSPAVTGMGGQGKTQLAIEFAYRFGRWFKGGVFWVSCADPAGIPEAVAACGLALFATDVGFSARPLPEQVALVGSAWATPFPRLLIFDNCEDETLVDAWAPKSGGCRLVITARRPSWSPARGITVVPLGRLARAESLALLHRHRADLGPDDPGLSGIADELGDLPLALELAGSYLARYRHEPIGSPAAYLAELRGADLLAHISLTNEHPEPPDPARSLTGHERDVARTFEVSLRRLQREDPVDAFALEILARASWLAPLPIPRRLLKLCVGLPPEEADAARRFTDGLDRLLKLAFVDDASEATGAVLVHRLVAAFARARVKDAGVARRALENAIVEEAYRVLPQKDPRPFRDWAGHLLAVALAAARDGTEAAIDLLNAAGLYSWMVADYEASEAMLRDVVERIQALHGPQNTMVANILDNLSSVQLERGDLANAEASTTRALDIKEKAYGRDHPQVAGTLSNLGNVQRARDKLANAEAHLARALAIDEKVYGPDSPEVARPLVNLALVQARQGIGWAQRRV